MIGARKARENYSREELLRAAHMAGKGATAIEVAEFLKTTPVAVYRMMAQHGLRLVERNDGEVCIPLRILSQHFDLVGRLAATKNADPLWLLAQIIHAVLSDDELTELAIARIGNMPKRKARDA